MAGIKSHYKINVNNTNMMSSNINSSDNLINYLYINYIGATQCIIAFIVPTYLLQILLY